MIDHAKAMLHESDSFKREFPFRLFVNEERRFIWPLHWHDETEVLYIQKGDFAVTVNGQSYPLKERDIVFIPGGRLHGFPCVCGAADGKRIFFQFDLSMLNGYASISKITYALHDTVVVSPREDPAFHKEVEQEVLRVIEDHHKVGAARYLALMARVLDFLSVLYRGFSNEKVRTAVQNESSMKSPEVFDGAFAYIQQNYSRKITLADIAGIVGFSECYFSRIFKKLTGMNFRQYLTDVRLRKAEGMLMDRSLTVAYVAYSTGFNSLATFERVFRQCNGCTPTEYRRSRENV